MTIKLPPLSKIDLNLLVVLDVLLREKSVGRTAERLHLTSPAISHSLKRLRLLFDNELLVRDGRRMLPTTRGEALAEILPTLLAQIEQALKAPEPFDPASSTRAFRLTAPDFMSSILPHLLQLVTNEAPKASVQLTTFSPTAILDRNQSRFDLLIGPTSRQSEDLRGTVIGSWPWTVFGRKNHPAFDDWSLAAWAGYPHLQVSASSPSGKSRIDREAAKQGFVRYIGAVVAQFSMAPSILARTDMLLTVPSVALADVEHVFGLERRDVPLALKPQEFSVFRSASSGDEPEIKWFHDHVLKAVKVLASSS